MALWRTIYKFSSNLNFDKMLKYWKTLTLSFLWVAAHVQLPRYMGTVKCTILCWFLVCSADLVLDWIVKSEENYVCFRGHGAI